MTLKNNRAHLLCHIKSCTTFCHHMWIQTGVMVPKQVNWILTPVTLTFDIWPWPFPWTLFLSIIITPENFMIIRWEEHCQKGVTDGQTDRQRNRQTDWTIHRAAWSQLKIWNMHTQLYSYGLELGQNTWELLEFQICISFYLLMFEYAVPNHRHIHAFCNVKWFIQMSEDIAYYSLVPL